MVTKTDLSFLITDMGLAHQVTDAMKLWGIELENSDISVYDWVCLRVTDDEYAYFRIALTGVSWSSTTLVAPQSQTRLDLSNVDVANVCAIRIDIDCIYVSAHQIAFRILYELKVKRGIDVSINEVFVASGMAVIDRKFVDLISGTIQEFANFGVKLRVVDILPG